MKQNFFAVDLGATSGRTILGSFIEGGLNLEEINRFPNHLIEVGGHFYWDIYALYRHIIDGLKLVAHRGESIASIGIDTWGVDFVLLGKDGNLLRQPYAYRDPHTVGAPEAFFSRISRSEVYGKTGIQVMNFNSLFQLDTLRRNHDSALEAADKVLFMPDALSYMLTGKMVTEYTIASTAQLVNAHTQRLEPELLKAVGLQEENFGRFVFPGEKIGTLTEEVQKITGLGAIPVIAVAGHDTGSAVAAVPALDRNFAYLSSGTWSLMGVETDAPVITAETEALNFTNEGGVEGTIRLLKNICGMWLLERCRLNWGDTSYPELITEADSCEPFRSLINPDDDCFANPADMEQAIEMVPVIVEAQIQATAIEFMERETILFAEEYLGKRFPDTRNDAYILLTFDGRNAEQVRAEYQEVADLCLEHGALDVFIVDTQERKQSVWNARGAFLEAIKASTTQMDECDVVVPRDRVADFIKYTHEVAGILNLRIPSFGHAGDGNLHVYLCRDDLAEDEWKEKLSLGFEMMYARAREYGGAVSGEHGIGYAKKEYLKEQLGDTQIGLMRRIKKAFDPNLILNPDKVV